MTSPCRNHLGRRELTDSQPVKESSQQPCYPKMYLLVTRSPLAMHDSFAVRVSGRPNLH